MKIKINYDRLGKECYCMRLSFYTRFIGFHDNVDVRETSERPAPTIAYKEMTLIDFYQMPRSPPKFFHAAPPFHKWILSFLFDPFKIMFDILSQKKKTISCLRCPWSTVVAEAVFLLSSKGSVKSPTLPTWPIDHDYPTEAKMDPQFPLADKVCSVGHVLPYYFSRFPSFLSFPPQYYCNVGTKGEV